MEPTVIEDPAPVAVTLRALAIVKLFKRNVPPTALLKVTSPAPAAKIKLRVSFASPSSVLVKEILPPAVEKVFDPFRVTAVGKARGVLAVLRLPPTVIAPVGVKVIEFPTISLGRERTPI